MPKRNLTNEDLLGPGVLMGREGEIINSLRDALAEIAGMEPPAVNSLAWSMVQIARNPIDSRSR